MNYYYLEDGEAIGPYNTDELEQLFNTGTINLSTQICEEGGQTWKGYRTLYQTKYPDAKRSFTKKPQPKATPKKLPLKKLPLICAIFNFLGFLCFISAALFILTGFITKEEADGIFNAIGSTLGGLFWLALSAYIKKKCY